MGFYLNKNIVIFNYNAIEKKTLENDDHKKVAEDKETSQTQKQTSKTLFSNLANEKTLFSSAANEKTQSFTQPLGGVKRRIGCNNDAVRRKQIKTSTSHGPADTFFSAKKKPPPVGNSPVDVEQYSRIRLRARTLDADELKDRMQGKLFIKCCMIDKMRQQIRKNDWVTIGVIVKKTNPQRSANNKLYSLVELADLDETTVTLFLFGKVHDSLFREIFIGDVIGVLNPTIMPPKG